MKMINENETSGLDNEFKKHRKKHSYVGRQMCVSLYVAMDITKYIASRNYQDLLNTVSDIH